MDKINKYIFNFNYIYKNFNKNNLINILDNLTDIERNIVFNKLYHRNNYNNINDNNIYDYTFLQSICILHGNSDNILIDLLKKYKNNININIKNSNGHTFLYYIAFNKNIEILELIYELYKDVNINILNNDGENILFCIIKCIDCNENIVRFLLEKDVKIQYKLLIHIVDSYDYKNMNILLKYLDKNDNNQYDYILEELYKYVIENNLITKNNKEIYNKLFAIKSNTKSAAKILAPA